MDEPHLPDPEGPQWGVLSSWATRSGSPERVGEEKPTGPTFARLFVARDLVGAANGILYIDHLDEQATGLIVIVRPDAQRQGIATALYAAATEDGIDVESLSGVTGLTLAGAAFQSARRSARALLSVAGIPARALHSCWDLRS